MADTVASERLSVRTKLLGYHLFSLAYYLMGEVERVYAWIDRTPDLPGVSVDAPATVMFQFKAPRRYGVLDVAHTPKMRIESDYYADDDRVEVIGERGILFVNRCTARMVDLPPLMMFRGGKTTAIPVEAVDWHDSFVVCTRHLLDALRNGHPPVLDGPTGKAVLQFTLAAQISARAGGARCGQTRCERGIIQARRAAMRLPGHRGAFGVS